MACAVPCCENKYCNNKSISYHRFPRNQIIRNRWLKVLNCPYWIPPRNSRICANHFAAESYQTHDESCVRLREEFGLCTRKLLRDDAVPTIFSEAEAKAIQERLSCEKKAEWEEHKEPPGEDAHLGDSKPWSCSEEGASPTGVPSTDATVPESGAVPPTDPDPPLRSAETQTLLVTVTMGTQTPREWEARWYSGSFFTCASCSGVFAYQQYADTPDMAVHVCKDGKTKCRFCECSCDKADDEIAEGGLHVCKVCRKEFTKKVSLDRHLKTAHRGHVCVVCGMKFQQKIHLKRHQRAHTSEGAPYTCEQCGKTFAQRKYLRNHRRVHTGERPYTCAECGARFGHRSNLRKHTVRIHTRDFPHMCTLCDRGFYVRVELMRHRRIAHTEGSQQQQPGALR